VGIHCSPQDTFEDLLFKLFLERVEPELGWEKPVFVTHYPFCMAALARTHTEPYPHAARFELYIAGVELANGYDELTDPREQRRRLIRDHRRRRPGEAPQLDERFLAALERGIPPCSGIAVGLDRLFMVLHGYQHLGEAVPFPHPE